MLGNNRNKGHLYKLRLTSLLKMINSETIKPIAVLMHHPPYEINLGPNIFHFDNLNTIAGLRFI